MQKLTLATLSTLAFTLVSTNVFAVDGTITVNGLVIDGTCILTAGGATINGYKNLTLKMPTISKSQFKPTNPAPEHITLTLMDATGYKNCDLVTSKAFKGIHFSVKSPTNDLDETDKTLLVNKTKGASTKNPVFVRIITYGEARPVDFSALWGTQAKSQVNSNHFIYYRAQYFSKTGIVDPQTYTATVNYTMHYN